jgi:hypothetical protein
VEVAVVEVGAGVDAAVDVVGAVVEEPPTGLPRTKWMVWSFSTPSGVIYI